MTVARSRPRPLRRRYAPCLEVLEDRTLPSAMSVLGDVADTLSHALDLGNLSVIAAVGHQESIGDSAAGAADVDWYHFLLSTTSFVSLHAGGANFTGVLSLYNNDPTSPDPTVAVLKHRLVAQSLGDLSLKLAAGDYFVAVSGAGNLCFNPFLPNSGAVGAIGAYRLDIAAAPLISTATDLTVLGSDIPTSGVFTESPLALHIRLDGDIDLSSSDVEVFQMQDGVPIDVAQLQLVYDSTDTHELQLVFNQGLSPGNYQVFVFGGPDFAPLFTPLSFTVAGIEGSDVANDTAATATDLGSLANGSLLQIGGFIGNNPAYDNFGDPTVPNPASDLDIYHFTVVGDGHYALTAEAFANRIGSPLDAGLTLFQVVNGQAVLLAGNNNTLNHAVADDNSVPLFTDPALFAALTAGEYFLVVSAAENTLDPTLGQNFGPDTYDPVLGTAPLLGSTTGRYVLNLWLSPNDEQAPTVTNVSIPADSVLHDPLTSFTVQFSEQVNLQQLAYQSYQQQLPQSTAAVFFMGPQGQVDYPRLVNYDDATATATFVMLDGLTSGAWELHLSGANGLADFSGNRLQGNPDPNGDYIIAFSDDYLGPADPLHREVTDPLDSFAHPQDLGVLFGHDIENGIVVTRNLADSPGDNADYFKLTVLQTLVYSFTLSDGTVPGRPVLLDDFGNALTSNPLPTDPTNPTLTVYLEPGTYVIQVEWDAAATPNSVYELHISLGADPENPTPLTQGPAPAFRLQLVTNAPPSPTPTSLQLPPAPPPSVVPALLSAEVGTLTSSPSSAAGALVGLSTGPVGVVIGPARQNPPLIVRLTLPGFELVSSEKTGVSASEAPQAADPNDPTAGAEDLGVWLQRVTDQLLHSLQPSAPPRETPPEPEIDLPLSEAAREAAEVAGIRADRNSGEFCFGNELIATLPAPRECWAGVLLALGGLTLVKDRQKRRLRKSTVRA
jgi:hypothetical protein